MTDDARDGGAAGQAGRGRRRALWTAVVVVVLAALAALVGLVLTHGTGTTPPAAGERPATTSAPATTPPPGTPVAPGPAATVLPADQAAADPELAQVAASIGGPVALTAPVEWARWAGASPSYAQDIDGCPQLAARFAALLGGRWTYAHGTLPQGPVGCSWVPVPYVPEEPPADRYLLSVGFVAGDPADQDLHTWFQTGGARCPFLDVAAGAVLARCDGPDQLSWALATPAADGNGVWYLTSTAGHDQQVSATDGLVALVEASTGVYG